MKKSINKTKDKQTGCDAAQCIEAKRIVGTKVFFLPKHFVEMMYAMTFPVASLMRVS